MDLHVSSGKIAGKDHRGNYPSLSFTPMPRNQISHLLLQFLFFHLQTCSAFQCLQRLLISFNMFRTHFKTSRSVLIRMSGHTFGVAPFSLLERLIATSKVPVPPTQSLSGSGNPPINTTIKCSSGCWPKIYFLGLATVALSFVFSN